MIKIYKIIDNTNGNIYIGKTSQKYLSDRLSSHVWDYKTQNKRGCVSRDIIKNGDYKIELIEETLDKSREKYWIENTSNCINKLIPGRTYAEWRKDNPDKRQEYFKTWGGSPYSNNLSLLKIDPNLFL